MSSAPLMVTVSGVRGIAHQSLTSELVETFVGSFAKFQQDRFPGKKLMVVLGKDSRVSGPEFETLAVRVFTSLGCDVYNLGICPTPTVQFMVMKLEAQAGLIITSSHNPTEWNGLKFVDSDGLFLSATRCNEMYAHARAHTKENPYFVPLTDASQYGKHVQYTNAMKDHIQAVTSLDYIHPEQIKAAGITACVDTINGAGSVYIPTLLNELGVKIVCALNTEPTGLFAHEPEPIPKNLTGLCEAVKKTGADIGIAVDPDADRLVLVNEQGEPLGEEYTLALCTEFMLGEKRGPVCKNRSTTHAIDDIAERHNCPCFASPVGEANVATLMLRMNAVFGGEGNGGIMNPDVHIGRDSLVGSVMVLQFLSEWRNGTGRFSPDRKSHIDEDSSDAEEAVPNVPFVQPRSKSPAAQRLDMLPTERKDRTISALKLTLPQYEIVKDKIPLSPDTTNEQIDDMLKTVEDEWKSLAIISTIDGLYIENKKDSGEEPWWVHLRRSNTERIVRIIGEARTKEQAMEKCALFHKYFPSP